MLSTLVATRKQSSSTKEKTMKKQKPTVRHLTIGYLTSTGTTPESGAATKQHHLHNQSSRRSILLTKKSTQNASYIQKESTRASNAALFAKHSEHLQLLPTMITKRKSTRAIYPSNRLLRCSISGWDQLPILVIHETTTYSTTAVLDFRTGPAPYFSRP